MRNTKGTGWRRRVVGLSILALVTVGSAACTPPPKGSGGGPNGKGAAAPTAEEPCDEPEAPGPAEEDHGA